MARVGYIEARNDRDEAKLALERAERALALLDADPPNIVVAIGYVPFSTPRDKESLQREMTRIVGEFKVKLDAAEQAFAVFGPKPKKKRIFYYDRFQVNLAVDEELGQAIRKQLKNGESLANLTRDALREYLLPAEKPF